MLRFADVRPALLGIVLRQRLIADAALAAGYSQYFFRAIHDRELHRIADVHRQRLVRGHQAKETLDFIGDVAEAAGLAAIAVNRKRIAAQRLLHEGGYYAAIVELHARPVGIENAHNARVHFPVTPRRHGGGFREALGFVIDRTRAYGIDVSPISLFLRMLQRIAVTFRS